MGIANADVLSMNETTNSNFFQGKSTTGSISSVEPKLRAALYDDENFFIARTMGTLETKIGVKREHVAYVICAITALYLMSGTGAGLVCNMIGCIYPIAAAIMVIRHKDSKMALSWLPFWVEYGSLLIVDSYADLILEVFPIYWLVKAIILLYLLMPQTRGARKIHKKISVPAFLIIREAIANKTQ
uniref:Receptor expression-enhancing protein n=1 Tax=Ascaris lumbricoides TaxID=6252 RepID=A0A0M3IND1_ASCLU